MGRSNIERRSHFGSRCRIKSPKGRSGWDAQTLSAVWSKRPSGVRSGLRTLLPWLTMGGHTGVGDAPSLSAEAVDLDDGFEHVSSAFAPASHEFRNPFSDPVDLDLVQKGHGDSEEYSQMDAADEPLSERQTGAGTSLVAAVSSSTWNSMLAHAFATCSNVSDVLPFPWETGTLKSVFPTAFCLDWFLQLATALT